MIEIRSYVRDKLLHPLKHYPTAIQETIIELIIEKLEVLYSYTLLFPEIVTPNSTRLDILKVIADQFVFTIRDDADLQEQINILDNVLYSYSKRGSIDTIENMWKYYGGELPRDVKVIIPAYSLFRYNVSKFSGYHVFQDGETNHTGLYEIRLNNSTYPIPELKEFLIKELVAAGNYIYFTNAITAEISKDKSQSSYLYDIYGIGKDEHFETFLDLQLPVSTGNEGLTLSGPLSSALSGYTSNYNYLRSVDTSAARNLSSVWSGKGNIFIDIVKMISEYAEFAIFDVDTLGFFVTRYLDNELSYEYDPSLYTHILEIQTKVYSTPLNDDIFIARYLYNSDGDQMREKYFILAESLLGESTGYEKVDTSYGIQVDYSEDRVLRLTSPGLKVYDVDDHTILVEGLPIDVDDEGNLIIIP